MKALLLVTLVLALVSPAYCIPAAGRNGKSTQPPSRNRVVKYAGEPEKTAAKNVLQNLEEELVEDITESGKNYTSPSSAENIKKSRRGEEKSRPRGKKRFDGTTIPTATTTTTSKTTEPSKTTESDFVFENDKKVQHEDEGKPVTETTEPSEVEDPKNVTVESAVTVSKVNTMERTTETSPVTSKREDSNKNVLKSSTVNRCHQHWSNFNDYDWIPPEYLTPQMEAPQSGYLMGDWNPNEPYDFYPSPWLEGRLPWSPIQEQPYETPYYPIWPEEEEQFYEMEPYWWDNEVHANEGRCHGKEKKKTRTTTSAATSTTTTTTEATTKSSSVATEPTTVTTTPVPTTTTDATKATIATPMPKASSTWLGIEDLLEAYKSDLMNDADASSRKQLSKMFHELIQNYEPLLNGTVKEKVA